MFMILQVLEQHLLNTVSKSQFEQNRDANMQKAMATIDKGKSIQTVAIKFNVPHSVNTS